MFEFIMLFIFFYWLSSKFSKDRKKRKLFKPSLDQELKELIQAEDNSTGVALNTLDTNFLETHLEHQFCK